MSKPSPSNDEDLELAAAMALSWDIEDDELARAIAVSMDVDALIDSLFILVRLTHKSEEKDSWSQEEVNHDISRP